MQVPEQPMGITLRSSCCRGGRRDRGEWRCCCASGFQPYVKGRGCLCRGVEV